MDPLKPLLIEDKALFVEAARSFDYPDREIADFLVGDSRYDIAGARKAGVTDVKIIEYMVAESKK